MKSIEYLAGYFDGEGCIYVPSKPPFGLVLKMGTGDEYALEAFKEAFGGSIRRAKVKKDYYKAINYWQLSGVQAQKALAKLHPHLESTKKIQAFLALGMDFSYGGKGHGARVPQLELEKRAIIELLVRKCKRVGCSR